VEESQLKQPLLVLLPGLDGTGELYAPLLEVIGGRARTKVICYPVDRSLSYAELLELVENELRSEQQMVLIGESFSGPIALRLAAKLPKRVAAVVLCASFIESPVPRWLRHLVVSLLFLLSPPGFVMRRFMVGGDASDSLVAAVREAIKKVRPAVIAGRLNQVLDLDCSDAVRGCACPILYLRAEQDALVGQASVDAIAKLKPDLTIRSLKGPHLLFQRAPAESWAEIVKCLMDRNVLEEKEGE
jgi:pimeloyl-[acyl-carrier protein] methyl ester esterase